MLTLTRKLRQRVLIGDEVIVTILEIDRNKVRLGIEAPPSVRVDREEYRKWLLNMKFNVTPTDAAAAGDEAPFEDG